MVLHPISATMSGQAFKHPHHVRNVVIVILLIPVCLFGALWFITFAASVLTRSQRIQEGNYQPATTTTIEKNTPVYEGASKALIEGTGNYSFGAENPKLTIVEFSDFACPFCRASFPAMREVGLRHSDTVKIIFRDWPGHQHSLQLAMGAYCAGEQGKFWEMHDKLFLSQAETFGANKNDLAVLAQQLGIYNTQYQSCFDNQKYLSRIRQNYLDSQTLGVKGTPTWFFNGQKVEGQLSSNDLEKLIISALE